jgi:hypothetical protein
MENPMINDISKYIEERRTAGKIQFTDTDKMTSCTIMVARSESGNDSITEGHQEEISE